MNRPASTTSPIRVRYLRVSAVICCSALAVIPANHASAQQGQDAAVQLRVVPEFRIDAADHDLGPIGWLLVGRDGTIAISQPQDNNVRFFSPTGAALGTFGRKGQGPGEFGMMTLAGWVGDTIWVGDGTTYRITMIAPDRSLVRSSLWPQGARPSDPSRPVPQFIATPIHAFYGDGSVAVIAIPSSDGIPAWMRQPSGTYTPFMRINKEGVLQRVLMWGHESDPYCRVESFQRPFCFHPFWAVSRRGAVFSTARIEGAGRDVDMIRVLAVDEDSDTLFSRSLPVRRERIPTRVRDSTQRAFEAMIGRVTRRPVPSVDIPEFYAPLVRAIVSNDERSLWLERGVTTGDRQWIVLDMSGRQVASVRVPRRIDLKVVSMERVWGTERDADGLEHIVVLRVSR